MNLPRTNEGRFLLLFFALSGVGLALLIWRETEIIGGWRDAVLRVVQDLEAVVVVAAIMAYAFTEGVAMLAERYKQRRYEEGKAEGRREERREILEKLDPQTREKVQEALEPLTGDARSRR